LELDPFQVQKLSHILTFSGREPILTLRNNHDKNVVAIRGTSIFDILGTDANEAKEFFKARYK
jgi:pilus assembly protein CpaB